MRRDLALLVVVGLSAGTARAAAQATGTTTFKVKRSTLIPFVEGRGEIGGGKTFILTGGVRF